MTECIMACDRSRASDIPIYIQDLIRCKDCKHYIYYGLSQDTVSECKLNICPTPDKNWFCADGEPKEFT